MTKSDRGERATLEQYDRLVNKLALSYYQRHMSRYELDDLVQVARIGLSDAYRSFDPTLGYKFITHAYNRVNFALSRYVRGNTGIMHIPYKHLNSDAEIPQRVVTRAGWEAADMFDGISRVELSEVLEAALEGLTDRQKTIVLSMYIEGQSAEELSEDLGVSMSTVYTDMRLAMSKMKRYFEEAGVELSDLLGED
jgi:RNA polymerase sigma factor (sigma-70 family)